MRTTSALAPHLTKADALALLHSDAAMFELNASPVSYTPLPAASASSFYAGVPAAHQPATASAGALPVYAVTEHAAPEGEGNVWQKTSWFKRFVPHELSYQTGVQHTPDGLVCITQAPMGVMSVTTWVAREEEAASGRVCVVDMTGKVTSNRMLMGFIKAGLQTGYERLARDFVKALENRYAAARAERDGQGEHGGDAAAGDGGAEEPKKQPASVA